MNKQLKGFTILEALISLILISIIIGLTYSLFNLIGKQMSLFEKENTQVLQYNLFNATIKSDINKATDFNIFNNELELEFYNKNTITYSVKNNHVLRLKSFKTDTFKVQVIGFKFLENSTLKNSNQTLELTLGLLNDTIQANYFLIKNNSEEINNKYFNED